VTWASVGSTPSARPPPNRRRHSVSSATLLFL
jgi:hypothetical protein